MNVAIVEDEALAAERLVSMLHKTGESVNIQAILETVEESVSFLSNEKKPDLLFLDIELADGRSFEIFNKVNVNVPIIFITAYDQYALQAFKHFSVDYLLKPVQQEDLNTALIKWRRMANHPGEVNDQLIQLTDWLSKEKIKPKERLLIKSGNKLQYKPTEEVAYFLADGKEVYIYTLKENKKFLIDYSLEQLESQLDNNRFFRISRKAIVNADAIAEIKGLISTRLEVKLNQPCEHELTISRDRSAAFKAWLDR
ncbi:MAG TPA: LytTR family DNA-binding domain-containing protein [Cyclobacteriaceae bacterium]|nr:LytTR family DNA-binding domain-containing protein [Cyclobacteriaceae bacterium]HPW60933.1 LytTR family DNA-binding domain-containing protein [Cyclobacteriaceae bacterium]